MRVVIQRCQRASVTIDNKVKASINQGFMVLCGFEESDTIEDMNYTAKKIVNLRVFNDENDVMNLSIKDIDGDILLISQFTLFAQIKKGNRPSYIAAAKPEIANPMYQQFISILTQEFNKPIYTGEFGADMKVELINDGPVTIFSDSKNKF